MNAYTLTYVVTGKSWKSDGESNICQLKKTRKLFPFLNLFTLTFVFCARFSLLFYYFHSRIQEAFEVTFFIT